jgi:hypothetical protein
MSELFNVLEQLKKDFVHYDKLWEEAKEFGNSKLADMIQEELRQINEMINEIERPEINRQRRIASNVIWRDFNYGRNK